MSYLQEAFREAARREFDMIPEEEEIEYSFSPKFLRKMRGLLRAEAYGYWKYVNTAAKRVAIAVAIIVMLLTSAMAIKPVRERVIKFFVEVYEEYFSITFGEKESGDLYAATEPMTRYTISWLPEGYIETKFVEKDVLYTTVWKNQEDIPMYLGHIVEIGNSREIFNNPMHPYTKALLEAVPRKTHGYTERRIRLKGSIPSPIDPPSGCPLHPRCPFATERCAQEAPKLVPIENRQVACHLCQESKAQ